MSGLLLLTSDTHLANWIADPENAVPRVYVVTVRGKVTADEAAQLDVPLVTPFLHAFFEGGVYEARASATFLNELTATGV